MAAPYVALMEPSAPAPPRRVGVEAYLAAEAVAETKHEYLDGVVRAMPGASPAHISVVTILTGLLDPRLRRAGGCRFLNNDVQIPVPAYNAFTYPDGAIACPPRYAEKPVGALLNPKVIFEALSPSTEAYDRGAKFRRYRSLPTLEEYVLLSSTEPLVEVFAAPAWGVRTYEGLDATVELHSVGVEIALRDLYADLFAPIGPPDQNRTE